MNKESEIFEKEVEERMKFLTSAKCNHTQHMYIDITGDLIQGTLLARIIYWFAKDKNKKLKVRIFKDGFFWIAKQRKDWWEEIRITERQYDKAIKDLEKKGFIVLAKYKFNSMPTIHIRPNYEIINTATNKWQNQLREQIICEIKQELQESENGNYTKCNSQGNDTKCKTGITQNVTLLTGITNNDYENKDYRTENTEKAFSKEKVSYKVFSSQNEEKMGEKHPPYNYNLEELETFIKGITYTLARKIEPDISDENINNISEIIVYFYVEYYKVMGRRHPILKDEVYARIISSIIDPPEPAYKSGYKYDVDVYKDMIENFFETDYGKCSGKRTDYKLPYFFSEKVFENLCWKGFYTGFADTGQYEEF